MTDIFKGGRSWIGKSVFTHIPAATSGKKKHFEKIGVCKAGLKSQSLLNKEALSIHLPFSLMHSFRYIVSP